MKFRNAYSKRLDIFATVNDEPSLTQASDAEDADINVIMARYGQTGLLPAINIQALTGDFSNVVDFREAQERIKEANDEFAKVPADLRRRFDNDPQRFIEWVTNDENKDEAIKLGYRTRAPEPEPEKIMKVHVVNENPKKD